MAKANLQMMAVMDRDELKKLSERDFQRALYAYAEDHGWLCHYMYKSAQKLADGSYRGLGPAGFPDVIAVRDGVLHAIECKSETGTATAAQREWVQAIDRVPGGHGHIWKPRDAEYIMQVLAQSPPGQPLSSPWQSKGGSRLAL